MSQTISPGPSRVHPRADASSSSSNGIPSSTVVGIGGGFVAFAVTVLSVFTLSRVIRLALRARRERESGTDVTFRELWNREGGFWGFMTGLGGESAAIGAGAHVLDFAQQRRWEQLVMRSGMMTLEEDDLRQKPEMWEFRVPEKSGIGEDAVHLKACRPLAVTSSNPHEHTTQSDPTLALSLLILLPTSPPHRRRRGVNSSAESAPPQKDEELPEFAVGTTTLLPIILPSSSEADTRPESAEKNGEKRIDIAHLHYETTDSRRAKWEETQGSWTIEGLGVS